MGSASRQPIPMKQAGIGRQSPLDIRNRYNRKEKMLRRTKLWQLVGIIVASLTLASCTRTSIWSPRELGSRQMRWNGSTMKRTRTWLTDGALPKPN